MTNWKRVHTSGTSQRAAWKKGGLADADSLVTGSLMRLIYCFFHKREWELLPETDVEVFTSYAREHGISGLLGALDNEDLLGSTELAPMGQENYISNIIQHEKLSRVAQQVGRLSGELKIPHVIFKGAALVQQVYGDGGIRSYGDLDILVAGKKDIELLLKGGLFQGLDVSVNQKDNSLMQPGRYHVTAKGQTVEFFYPIQALCDPMFDFLDQHGGTILGHEQEGTIHVPPLEMHFIFLLFHMQKHLCTRFIWHLDLLLFAQKYMDVMDRELVEYEMQRLQLCQYTHQLSCFYRDVFDFDLGVFAEKVQGGWNTKIIENLCSEKQLHAKVGVQRSENDPVVAVCTAVSRFFVMTDPQYHSIFSQSRGAIWLASLVAYNLKVHHPVLVRVFAKMMLFIAKGAAPLVNFIILRRFNP